MVGDYLQTTPICYGEGAGISYRYLMAIVTSLNCSADFPSRNQLFTHLADSQQPVICGYFFTIPEDGHVIESDQTGIGQTMNFILNVTVGNISHRFHYHPSGIFLFADYW